MNHKYRENYYKCHRCGEYGLFDINGDPKENEFYLKNSGLRDCFCKTCRLLNNQKYRAPKKGKRPVKVKQEKNLSQIYKEIGRSKLSGCNRGNLDGFRKYFKQNPLYFKDIYHEDWSDSAAEAQFGKVMGV